MLRRWKKALCPSFNINTVELFFDILNYKKHLRHNSESSQNLFL